MSRTTLWVITISSVTLGLATFIVSGIVLVSRSPVNEDQTANATLTGSIGTGRSLPLGDILEDPDQLWSAEDRGKVRGPCRIKLTKAEVRRIPLKTGLAGRKLSDKPVFSVSVEVANVSKNRIVRHQGWARSAVLIDNFFNRYGIPEESPNSFFRPVIRPGESVSIEVIVFEQPLDQCTHLDLILPGDEIEGHVEPIHFRIPASAIMKE